MVNRIAQDEWVEKVRKHLAVSSVGNSTLMKQSGKDRVKKAREFLINTDIKDISKIENEDAFQNFLDKKTEALAKILPRIEDGLPNWGAARKVINIYLRLCVMNKDLNSYLSLSRIESFLEVPLDRHVVKKINSKESNNFKIKCLEKDKNKEIQGMAYEIAKSKGLHRYELDIIFWNYDLVE